MSNTKKIIGALVILSMIVLAIWIGISQNLLSGKIKIGVILPLTGDGVADQGQASQKSIELAVSEINDQGGIEGKKLEAIFEDSQCQAQNGVTAVNKLINVDKVNFLIGDICDGVTGVIMPIAEKNKIVLITPGSTSPAISDAGDYIYRLWFSENDLGGMVADAAFEKGLRKFAILYINNAWGVAQKDGVKKRFEELGGRVVSEQEVDPSNVDYRTEVLKAKKSNPDAYYFGLSPDGLIMSMNRFKELGIKKPVYSHGGLVGSAQTLGTAGDSLEGIVAPFVFDSDSQFKTKFVAKFNKEPGTTADSSYDAVNIVAKVMKESKSFDSEAIKEGLNKIKDYEGASGKITIDEKGDAHRPLRLMVVKAAKLIPLSQD